MKNLLDIYSDNELILMGNSIEAINAYRERLNQKDDPDKKLRSERYPKEAGKITKTKCRWVEKKGIKHGFCKWYFKTSQIMIDGYYKNGVRHGAWIEYFGNGEIKEKGFYKNDQKVGKWYFFGNKSLTVITEDTDINYEILEAWVKLNANPVKL